MFYQLTYDKNTLKLIIKYIDEILDLRNNAKTGIKFWNNKKEKLWITNINNIQYAGSENADTYGHILYCTKLILKNQKIHKEYVYKNITYEEKALYYLYESKHILENYFI